MKAPLWLAGMLGLVAGCTARSSPYRFRSPVLLGVSAADLPTSFSPVGRPREMIERAPTSLLSVETVARLQESLDLPRRARAATHEPSPEELVGTPSVALLTQVGDRTDLSDLEFVLLNLSRMGATLAPALAHARGNPDFFRVLVERAAISDHMAPLLGDLVLFDEGWLVGLVTSVRDDGTAEFVYAQRGVVRRGWVNGLYGRNKRDAEGRILNTFVRPYQAGDRSGQRYLAGEMLTGFVRLDEIVLRP